MVPKNLNDSTVVTVLSMMESEGSEGRASPEVHGHLHCFERVELQIVKTAPDSQLFRGQLWKHQIRFADEQRCCDFFG